MSDLVASVSEHAELNACLKLSLDRDESDSYALKLERYTLDNTGSFSNISVSDLTNLLPTGTSFRKVVGWRSIYGAQFIFNFARAVAVGIEEIVPHAFRGAFPRSTVFVYPDLSLAVGALKIIGDHLPAPATNAIKRYDIYPCKSATPEAHCVDEASAVYCAKEHWLRGTPFLFRTLLIDETSLWLPGYPSPPSFSANERGLRFVHDRWLINVTETVRAECKLKTRIWMKLREWQKPQI